jgi:hypothetical protein
MGKKFFFFPKGTGKLWVSPSLVFHWFRVFMRDGKMAGV